MYNLDDLFLKEFNSMMRQLKGINGNMNILELELPHEVTENYFIESHDKVFINNITDEYYSRLNGSVAHVWSRPDLKRRKFDSKGNYIKDKNGNYVLEDITLPHSCLAIVSDRPIGVKTKYKPKEDFIYVDVIPWKLGNKSVKRFVYVVPRKYCHKVNQSAVVVSLNKMTRDFYSGFSAALVNGSTVFVYVIPYKPSTAHHAYRVLVTGDNPENLFEVAYKIYKHWIDTGKAFNPDACEIPMSERGRENAAKEDFVGMLDSYQYYLESTMDKNVESLDSFDYDDNVEETLKEYV